MLKTIQQDYYGDNTRWFVATVVSHTPPYGYEGRVKIRIHGVHSDSLQDVPDRDLPWAQVVLPTTEGGTSGIGRTPQLLSNALVFGFFLDGETSQVPVVLGSLPKRELPNATQQIKSQDDINIINLGSDGLTDRIQKKNRQRAEAMKFFMDNGYTIEQSAGIVGNVESINGFDTTILDGICGWDQSRLRELKIFGQSFSTVPETQNTVYLKYYVQLRFILRELRTTKGAANGRLIRSKTLIGRNGAAEIIRQHYINPNVRRDSKVVLEHALRARLEVNLL